MKTFSEIITFANRPTGSGQIYTEDVLKSAFDIYMSKDKDLRRGCIDAPVGGVVTYDICSYFMWALCCLYVILCLLIEIAAFNTTQGLSC